MIKAPLRHPRIPAQDFALGPWLLSGPQEWVLSRPSLSVGPGQSLTHGCLQSHGCLVWVSVNLRCIFSRAEKFNAMFVFHD